MLLQNAERESTFNALLNNISEKTKEIEFNNKMKNVENIIAAQKAIGEEKIKLTQKRVLLAVMVFVFTILIRWIINRRKRSITLK